MKKLLLIWGVIVAVLFGVKNFSGKNDVASTTTTTNPKPTTVVYDDNESPIPDSTADTDEPEEDLSEREPPEKAEVSLDELKPYVLGDSVIAHEYGEDAKDTLGNMYSVWFRGYMDPSDGEASETYYVNSEYQTLSGVVAVCESSESIGKDYWGELRILGDGKLLKTEKVKCDTKPYDISVDISGVEDLQIEMYGMGNLGPNGISIIFGDPVLVRKS